MSDRSSANLCDAVLGKRGPARRPVELEESIRGAGGMRGKTYLHRSCKPLVEVDFSNDIDRGQMHIILWDGKKAETIEIESFRCLRCGKVVELYAEIKDHEKGMAKITMACHRCRIETGFYLTLDELFSAKCPSKLLEVHFEKCARDE